MEEGNKSKKELTIKQNILLYFYKSLQYIKNKWYFAKEKIKKFIDSFYFYLIFFGIFVFFLHKALLFFNTTATEDNLHSFAFAVAGIVGASIAIIFSFSTFILQSTSDLFSTQFLKKFIAIQDHLQKLMFWLPFHRLRYNLLNNQSYLH